MLKSSNFIKQHESRFSDILSKIPFSPNQITILALLSSILGLYNVILGNLWTSLLLFAISFLLDALDGAVARAKNVITQKGAFIDGVFDRLTESFLLIGVLLYFDSINLIYFYGQLHIPIDLLIILNLVFGTFYPSFIKAYSDHTNTIPKEKALGMPGIFERAERCVAYLTVLLFIVLEQFMFAYVVLVITFVLSFITTVQRFFYVYFFSYSK
ncbi:MAG: CDP-alcohol phosphatidyltransferase family protein [Candidatus Micrarchaeota archaeon]|nr:CDP-alcohol phosphatidyltransferase family protein [Candidatus Micrarchaeota archaeon]